MKTILSHHTRYFLGLALLALGAATHMAMGQEAPRAVPELVNLKAAFLKDLAAATQPVESRYRADLESLLKSFTQRGDLASANAVQEELKRFSNGAAQVQPAYPKIFRLTNNAWKNKSGSSRLVFYIGEKYHENWEDKVYKGTWKAISDTEAVVERSDGAKLTFRLDVEKQELIRVDPREAFHPSK